MPQSFITKRGNTKPIRIRLQKQNDLGAWIPAPISGGAVRFLMRRVTGEVVVNATATIVQADAVDTIVQYVFAAADTAAAGKYRGEFAVTYASGVVETFPADGYILVVVEDALA